MAFDLKNRTASNNREVHGFSPSNERDNADLARLGKKPVLKVGATL